MKTQEKRRKFARGYLYKDYQRAVVTLRLL